MCDIRVIFKIWKTTVIIKLEEGGCLLFIFRLLKSISFFVTGISLYFFHLIKYYHIIFINVVFRFGSDRSSELLFV